jgi:TolA-binding protein
MSPSHRKEMAAELIARVQQLPAPAPRWRASVVVVAALAAAVAVVVAWPRATGSTSATLSLSSPETSSIRTSAVARVEAPPQLAAPKIEASGGAVLSRRIGVDRDVLSLVDGVIELDTRMARNVDVRVGDAVIRVDDAAVKITARKRTIISVQVVVGAARVISADQHVTLQRDSLWMPGPSAKQQSMSTFTSAWIALRAGRNHEAMELFDQVTDPVALEEASYWAAVAAKRAGDVDDAKQRFTRFLARFPASEYAAQIQAP